MPLSAIVDDINVVEDGIRGFYKPIDDEESPLKGKFILDVEPFSGDEHHVALEDITGLRNSLSATRREFDSLRKKVKDFDGLDPRKAREAIAKMEQWSKLDPEKEADRIAQAKFEQARVSLVEEWEGKIADLEKRLNETENDRRRLLIDGTIKDAVKEAKGRPPLERLIRDFVRPVEHDGRLVIEVVDEKGQPRFNNKGEPMSVSELVRSLRTNPDYGGLFESSAKSGTGSDPSGTGMPGIAKRRSEMSREEKADFIDKHGQDAYLRLPA